MKSKIHLILFISFFSVLILETSAQQLSTKKLHQSKIHLDKVERISVDRLGGFYLTASCGLEKFDPDGHEKEKYQFRNCVATEVL